MKYQSNAHKLISCSIRAMPISEYIYIRTTLSGSCWMSATTPSGLSCIHTFDYPWNRPKMAELAGR